ncbi:MAG: MFS transporter [Candidatus Bathyarchaeota archaeon]|nr:MAG: MFS transporter [Candidatus Bathyarchaeota archaeon]
MLGFLTENLQISFRKFLALMFLFTSSFGWFLSFFARFDDIFSFFINSEFWLNIGNLLFLSSVIVSAFIGSMVVDKVARKKLLLFLTLFGLLSSVPLLFSRDANVALFLCVLLGASFGSLLPLVQSFFTDSTIPEERGRVSGFLILSIFIFAVFAMLIIDLLSLDSIGMFLIMIGLKLTGFLPFLLVSIADKVEKAKPWLQVLKNKDFGIYLLAYILFNVCSGLVTFIWSGRRVTEDFLAEHNSAMVLRYFGIAIIAVFTGFWADKFGRKKPVILGVVMLGVAYALVGLTLTPDTYFLQLVFSGLAWGILIVIYNIIPGDLAFPGSEYKFYTLGIIIPFILYTGINSGGRFLTFLPPLEIFSTILSIVLFLSVIPILYAKETVSESKIQTTRLKEHIKKVKKVMKKAEKENNKP